MILRKRLGFCCFGSQSDIFKGSVDTATHDELKKRILLLCLLSFSLVFICIHHYLYSFCIRFVASAGECSKVKEQFLLNS